MTDQESVLVLTDDEWLQLAEICSRWIDGNTNYYQRDEELEVLARRVIKAANVSGDGSTT